MNREQFFKPNGQEEPKADGPVSAEKPADWEVIKAQHLAAKEAFREARRLDQRTGKEKYLDRKFRKSTKELDRIT